MNKYFESIKSATNFSPRDLSVRKFRHDTWATSKVKLINQYKPVGIAALTAAALCLNTGAKTGNN